MKSDAPLASPDSFHLSSALGWLELGLPSEARNELASIEASSDHPDVLDAWWKLYSEEENWNAALDCGDKLVKVAPERANGWISRSFALHELKRTQEAFDLLLPAFDRFKDQFVIPYNLACYQCQLENSAEALRWIHRAVEASDPRLIRSMVIDDPDLASLRSEILKAL